MILIDNRIKKSHAITLSTIIFITNRVDLLNGNLRRKNDTVLNKFWCRNIANDLTINLRIIHSRFRNSCTVLRCCSKEVATICSIRKILSRFKERFFDAIMRFVKVNCIDMNICLLNTTKRIIGSKNHLVSTGLINPITNHTRICAAIVMGFTSMNVHHGSIGDKL